MTTRPVDILWVLVSSGLVFIMQMGFLCLEAGFTRSKNSINVALKNLTDFGISMAFYWAAGFALMFGSSQTGWVGATHFFLSFEEGVWETTFFLFQVMFCGTAVTIVSGAVAERMRFFSYLFVATVVSLVIYPIFGHWAWGGALEGPRGWLAARGFVDFAGSTVVHGVGGAVSLACLLVLGPRAGRFVPGEEPRKISGSDIPLSMLGVLLLWLGWIGFNGGSTLALNDQVPRIIANTMLAGGFGLCSGLVFSWWRNGYPAVDHTANGSLAGLVAITANCHAVSSGEAALIGAVGAIVMIFAQDALERARIDDAVGAVPVHLATGIWGTLAVALFGDPKVLGTGLSFWDQLGMQCLGIGVCFAWTFGVAYLLFSTFNRIRPMRVTLSEEHQGLNVVEHRETTEILDLLRVMEAHAVTQDLSLRAPIEPFTEIGQIAQHYNRVMEGLQAAAVEMQAIVRTAKDGIITFARDSLAVLSVNPSAELIFGSPSHSMLGQSFWSLVEPRAREVSLDDILRESNRGATSELRGKRPDQKTFPVEVILTQAEVKDGWIYVGTFRDISANKELEDQLRQAQKMEGIGQLAGGIAHDFNNLLTVISGFTEVSRLRTEPGTPIYESLGQILQAGDRAAALTRQLLAFSRRKPSKRELLDVPEIVESMHRMLRRLIGSDIELVTLCRSDAARVVADRTEFEQVILNLAVNARDAMPLGGKLVIETSVVSVSAEDAAKFPAAEPGEHVQVAVSDTGLGMGPETKRRVFEPFFTTKDVDKGTGLGLAVVYGIVTHAGGHIEVDSEQDHGTTFTVRFPQALGSVTPASSTPLPARSDELQNVLGDETILLVEDEERLCKLVEQVLTGNGYHVLTAHNGSEALELAQRYKGRIDLLLTDVVMPQMRGSELARQLLLDRPGLRVLFMSGYVQEAHKSELLTRGDFIQKPFVTAHLSRRVRDLLDRSRSARPKPAE